LIRVPAIDGMHWADGEDEHGRPRWHSAETRWRMGLTDAAYRCYNLLPTEAGCNLSHAQALNRVADSGQWAIVIEDDVAPVDGTNLSVLDAPDDADVYLLTGTDFTLPGCDVPRVAVNDDGEVTGLRTLAGYAVSPHAASVMSAALFPLVYLNDKQISQRCFSCCDNKLRYSFSSMEQLKTYAPSRSLIRHTDLAWKSTFTDCGRKPWVEEYQIRSE
jgi:hypothetical protein